MVDLNKHSLLFFKNFPDLVKYVGRRYIYIYISNINFYTISQPQDNNHSTQADCLEYKQKCLYLSTFIHLIQ